jgi:hypothetical protein
MPESNICEPPPRRSVVAQTGSLLYRGLAIRNSTSSPALADCPSAKQQTGCLRYARDIRWSLPSTTVPMKARNDLSPVSHFGN